MNLTIFAFFNKSIIITKENFEQYKNRINGIYKYSFFYNTISSERMAIISAVKCEHDVLMHPIFKISNKLKDYEKLYYRIDLNRKEEKKIVKQLNK